VPEVASGDFALHVPDQRRAAVASRTWRAGQARLPIGRKVEKPEAASGWPPAVLFTDQAPANILGRGAPAPLWNSAPGLRDNRSGSGAGHARVMPAIVACGHSIMSSSLCGVDRRQAKVSKMVFIVPALIIGGACYLLYRRQHQKHKIMSLEWKGRLDYFKFRKTLVTYFRLNGWKLLFKHDYYPDLVVEKGNRQLHVRPLPDLVLLSEMKLRDYSRFTVIKDSRFRVCVAASPIPKAVLDQAKIIGVPVVYYKRLAEFIQAEDFKSFCLSPAPSDMPRNARPADPPPDGTA
jgi:hypothetical protein